MAFSKEQMVEHSKKLKAKGICPRCHHAKLKQGEHSCSPCKASIRANNKARRIIAHKTGLCHSCNKPVDDPSKRHCVNCMIRAHERKEIRRNLW